MSQDFTGSYVMVKYGEKSYCRSNIPSKGDDVVAVVNKENEGQLLRLHQLGSDLSSLQRFVRIAYFGVTGRSDLQTKVQTNLRSVFELCHDTAHTLNDFKCNSHEALKSLQTVYRYLCEAMEEQALEMLLHLQEMCKIMAENARNLAKEYNELLNTIKEDGDTTLLKRDEVKNEKESIITKIEKLQDIQKQTYKDIKDADSEKRETHSDLQCSYIKEEEAIEKLIQATEDNKKKSEEFRVDMHKKRENISSVYRKETGKAEENYLSTKEEIEKKYLEQIQTNKKNFEAPRQSCPKFDTVYLLSRWKHIFQ